MNYSHSEGTAADPAHTQNPDWRATGHSHGKGPPSDPENGTSGLVAGQLRRLTKDPPFRKAAPFKPCYMEGRNNYASGMMFSSPEAPSTAQLLQGQQPYNFVSLPLSQLLRKGFTSHSFLYLGMLSLILWAF